MKKLKMPKTYTKFANNMVSVWLMDPRLSVEGKPFLVMIALGVEERWLRIKMAVAHHRCRRAWRLAAHGKYGNVSKV